MARFGIVGCGYVGAAVARRMRSLQVEVTGTTTSPNRLQDLCDLVDHPRIYCAGDANSDASFLDDLDGLLIAMAPTSSSFEEDHYQAVYGDGVSALVKAIQQRRRRSSLHITYLSSGVYGDQRGNLCNELTPPDQTNTANALLVQAERSVLDLNTSLVHACVLLLGGIYGPD